jgi:molybdate transport system permease protein
MKYIWRVWMIDFAPFVLTLKLAIVTTVILLVIATPLAYFLATTKSRLKPVYESVVALPLVLPPSVLGFYFLLAFSDDGFVGQAWGFLFDAKLAFSFPALVIGSVIFSLPFMTHPLLSGFESMDRNLKKAAMTLGKSPLETFFRVELPMIRSSIITGVVLAFAHTVGEFGVVLMIGGNIEGVSRVASIAIYDKVESFEYTAAHTYSAILFIFSFAVLFLVYKFNKKRVW